MSLYPVKGKPGRFVDSETGDMILFCAFVEGDFVFPCDGCKKDFDPHAMIRTSDYSVFCAECAAKRPS